MHHLYHHRLGGAPLAAGLATVLLFGTPTLGQRGADVDSSQVSAGLTVQYVASTENFPNPERGFYRQLSPFNLGAARTPLNPAALRQYRDEGISLLRAYYIIDEFRNALFPAETLNALNADFAAVRSARIKIIPRFTYSFPCVNALEPCSPATYGNTDAPLPQVLAHIDQLALVLQANADVIAFMEMGFVGAWGEWHDSTNGLLATAFTANESSAAIVARVLTALPVRRMANIALLHQKQAILGISAPLTAAQAFTGTPQARIGHQDDCLLATATNGNTYINHYPPENRDPEPARQYLSADNRYVPQGGETCSFAQDAQPFIQCPNALAELARIRWSALHIGYQPQVVDLWRQQGCFGEIARRLGYRLRLVGAEVPPVGAPGGRLSLRIAIANDGFASPYNPRALELILRETTTRREYALPLNADPRFWGGGETQLLDLAADVPVGILPGTYEAFLNLPDPEPTLRGAPEYSIRLANQGVWEPSTGYNSLLATIAIGGAPVANDIVLHPATVSGLSVTLQWTASNPAGTLGYVVEAGTASGLSNLYNGSIGSTTTISSAVAAGTYYVRVRPQTAQGLGSASNEVSFTIAGSGGCSAPPPSPAALTGAVVNEVAQLNWGAVAGATSYIVRAGSVPGASDRFNGSVGSTVAVSAPVSGGFRAYVRVHAVNACGQSGPSNELLLQ